MISRTTSSTSRSVTARHWRSVLRGVLACGLCAVAWLQALHAAGQADEPRPEQTVEVGGGVTLVLENDMFFNTDRYYTNGVSAAFTTSRSVLPERVWDTAQGVLDFGRAKREDVHHAYGLELAQLMATPRSILYDTPQPDDRPWAGLLYLAPSLNVEAPNRLYTFKFMFGVVGPWSLADKSQAEVHRIRHFDLPRGWKYQIPNEPVVGLAFEERRRYRWNDVHIDRWNAEAISSVGYKAGTIEDSVRLGLELRAGFRLPPDFGSTLIGSTGNIPGAWGGVRRGWLARPGAHVFVGASGTAVLRQVMLDGTVFHRSPRIGREPLVSRLLWGWSVTSDHLRFTYQEVVTSREFTGQPDAQRFSSVSVSYYW